MVSKNTIPIRVPKEFKDFLECYHQEKIKEAGYPMPKRITMQNLMKDFMSMKEKLKDADVIIKKSKLRLKW